MIARTPYKGLRGHPSFIQSSNLHFARATVLDGIFIVRPHCGPAAHTGCTKSHGRGPRDNTRTLTNPLACAGDGGYPVCGHRVRPAGDVTFVCRTTRPREMKTK